MPLATTTFDTRLASRVIREEGGEITAATTFLERHDPATLEEAVSLFEVYGKVTPQAFDHIDDAWGIYWHLRDMSGD